MFGIFHQLILQKLSAKEKSLRVSERGFHQGKCLDWKPHSQKRVKREGSLGTVGTYGGCPCVKAESPEGDDCC